MKFTEIQKYVNEHFKLDITKKTRIKNYVEARYIYFKLCQDFGETRTLSSIGQSINKDHATVLHGLKTISDWMLYDQKLLNDYETLYKFLRKINNIKSSKETLYFSLAKKMDKMNSTIKKLETKVKEYESQNH
tara:strand:- start:1171 stop:1569 length:399 start_codon:yes stop_codon:yes gene_type:complete